MRISTNLLLGVSIVSMAVASAHAQETIPTETEDEVQVQETVVVTGSRIPTDPNLGSSVPVQSVDDDDIRLSGEINLADVVNDIPALVSSLTAENSATGANALNLRGLGEDRTLTLVNGRRHVAGFRGSQAVDIGSIPRALVESVEVTTGGASAVYGSDAVTGVVNFILKDDFEGFQLDLRGGIASEGDAENFTIDAIYGTNFHNDRGNVVLALSYTDDSELTYGDRDWAADNGIDSIGARANPDPDGPPLAVISDPRFWLTSQEGSIAPGFGGRDTVYVDINGNGIADCQESEGGRTGFLAGCWLTNPDGSVRVNQDGTVLNSLWGIGGDGGRLALNEDTLLPTTDTFVVNLNSTYEIRPDLSVFFEGKFVQSESQRYDSLDTFYDTLAIQPDNPFIPAELQPVVDVTGGLLITQDPVDFSDRPETFTRETYRFVAGAEWQPVDGHFVEVAVNHGVFENTSETASTYTDRVFAAFDATTDANGNIVCRSDIDPTAAYEIDYFTSRQGFASPEPFGAFSSSDYFSFTPGDGQCAPLNPFGFNSVSPEAQAFITADLESVLEIEQTVFSAIATGSFDPLEGFTDGDVGYAVGVEYREESSDNQLDPLTLGILPEGTPLTAGLPASDFVPYVNQFIGIDNLEQFNTSGGYSVTDLFAEIRLPILIDRAFAEELTFDAAVRFSDYSTLGQTTTWKLGGTWAPVQDLRIRATVSEAVRAPNITELFDPRLPIQVDATADPCDPGNINTGTSVRLDNCVAGLQAAGVPLGDILDGNGDYIWVNPLTGRFNGVSGGNPALEAETAETFTIGAVFTPSFVDGLSFTLDYWDITIENGISAVAAGDILDGCHDSASFPSLDFCNQFTRGSDGGLNFLESGETNFANLEASGFDFSANYSFDVGPNTFGASLVGSQQETLDFFFNPLDTSDVNPEVGEVQVPEWSGNLTLSWNRGPISASFQTTYQDEQAVDEIEDVLGLGDIAEPLYGDAGFFDETYIFDVNAAYEFSDWLTVYGGVNNIADEEPFATQTAWPVGPRGRFFFLGVTYTR